jgi:uncharacterized protein (TIGR00251 family)
MQNIQKAITKNLTNNRIYLIVKAKPNSKKCGISTISDSEIGICVKAPAVDNKANLAMIEYLSDIFDISKSDVILERGGSSRNKLISIDLSNLSEEETLKILNDNLI